ncbi:hypothetical protein NH288_08085 [Anaerococcus sp. NML200537]|uniref:hypothetical protein n=1 Tax=Anaerococcus sp. NML200537 TaxID=2954485 RepID=UPI00223836C2|nr:hypothetical protein [Anaerococcus sp. NML200537]MCW6702045.1 hypothetical protein [Anaerococcus sp. NML200537]
MKYFKNNFASILCILSLLSLIFKAFLAKYLIIDENLIERSLTSLIIAYLAFKISFIDTKKVFIMFVPLIFYSLVMAFVVNGSNLAKVPYDIVEIITNIYRLILMVGGFFILELIINQIFGSSITPFLAGLCLLIFFAIIFVGRLDSLSPFKDYFLYFSFYLMAIKVRSASNIRPVLLVLALGLVAGEVYLKERLVKVDYGFMLTIFPLTYLALKTISKEEAMGFSDYLIFGLIYIYPALFVIIKTRIPIEDIGILIISILVSYIIAEAIYKIKNKYLSYLLLGID